MAILDSAYPLAARKRMSCSLPFSRRELLRGVAVACAMGHVKAAPTFAAASDVGPVMAALSDYMAAAKDRALPAEVVEKAKHHILDAFAAMLSGSKLPPGQAALALARAQSGRRVATVIGSTVLTGPVDAALVNGVLG